MSNRGSISQGEMPSNHSGSPHRSDSASPNKMMMARGAPQYRGQLVKPKTRNVKRVARWEPVNANVDQEDDEFDLATCMKPVYEGEGEQGNEGNSGFKNGSPDYDGDIMSCFDEPNLLYRIINKSEKSWAFYNDSHNYEMHIQFNFGKHSKIEPLGNTTMERNDAGEFVTQVIVYPTETEMFITGSVNGFTSKLRAVPLSDDYYNERHNIAAEKIQEEQNAIHSVCGGNNKAEEVLQACIENGVMFVDPEFPPCQESLDMGAKKPFKRFAWARPQMYLPEEMADQVRLFRTKPQPGCVDPGELGDSWVMCAISSITEEPARLMGMFRHPEGREAALRENAVGAYRVTFSKNGWWRSVLVDSYLPISAGKPKYAKSATDPAEIWPCILEKAYAKLHGSYAKICSGDPLHALQDMTGFSTVRIDDEFINSAVVSPDADSVLKDVQRGLSAGYTVIFSTPGKDPKNTAANDSDVVEQYRKVGLLTGHAYTLIDAKAFPDLETCLVKIRNAWGRGIEWNGDWGDNSKRWDENPDVAEECNFQKAEDGTFWMDWKDAHKYFNGGGICFSRDSTYDYRVNCAFNDCIPSVVLEVDVKSPTWVTFVISQQDKREHENSNYDYQPVMISVAEPEGEDNYRVTLNSTTNGIHPSSEKWTFLQGRDVSLIKKFEAGKYLVIPRMFAKAGQPEQVPFVLGVIANKEIGTDEVTVRFATIDSSNRVFENFPKFEPELTQATEVQFQKRCLVPPFPITTSGQSIE